MTLSSHQYDISSVSSPPVLTLSNHEVTAFASLMNLNSNTPNQKGATRAQIAQHGDNFLMTNDPASPLYYGYNYYTIPTDFAYVGIKHDLSNGWSFDDKVYTMRSTATSPRTSTATRTGTSSTTGPDPTIG